jgi:glycosidase
MVNFVKGEVSPRAYFDLFKNSRLVQKGSHTWFKDRVVTSFDDHDHVDQGNYKHRFAALGAHALMLPIFGVNATTLGIPCIYYGSEQAFDGEGGSDRYIREAMFGGEFGPFRSRGHHCFDESNPIYRAAAEIHALRKRYITLRRGRQYLRQISSDGEIFGFPERIGSDRMRSIVAWSRLFDVEEIVCAINTDPDNPRTAFVTIEDSLHEEGDALTCLYSTEPAERGQTVKVVALNGKTLPLTVGAAGFVVYG